MATVKESIVTVELRKVMFEFKNKKLIFSIFFTDV